MRKNEVNRKIQEIPGGVCAPKGFLANAVHCGIEKNPEKKDLALISADWRCPTACVFSTQSDQSAPAKVSKKHLKHGIAKAILINSGIANVYLENGEEIAEKICRIVATTSNIEVNETLLASTGKVGEPLSLSPFERGIPALCKGLSATEEGSFAVAEAIMTSDRVPRHTAFSFDLGDIPCKMGVVYKGMTRVAPNMATTIVVLTTDVNILPEMLEKALHTAVNDTLNLISIDGISSPNDTVCIFANGKAGNYRIFCDDTEYAKFVYALREVLAEVSRRIIREGDVRNRLLECSVSGARSKQVARGLAKRLAMSSKIKSMLLKGELDPTTLVYEANEFAPMLPLNRISISIGTREATHWILQDGRRLDLSEETCFNLSKANEVILHVDLAMGNFGATGYGCIQT